MRYLARKVDGILLLDKPSGLSSNAVLQRVKRLFRAERAGHTGTLDPLASGMLPVCFGEATKFGGALLEANKGYCAKIKLGERTETGDAEGAVIERNPVAVSRSQLDLVLQRFRGEIEQVPPMYSALKYQGRPLYELARKGQVIERKSRRVLIRKLSVLRFDEAELIIDVECSKGTYIRTLAEDIGIGLGCGAHLAGLRRTAIGQFCINQAQPLDQLEGLDEPARDKLLLAVDSLVESWRHVVLSPEKSGKFLHGQSVNLMGTEGQALRSKVAVYDSLGKFLGIGEVDGGAILSPVRLLRTQLEHTDTLTPTILKNPCGSA